MDNRVEAILSTPDKDVEIVDLAWGAQIVSEHWRKLHNLDIDIRDGKAKPWTEEELESLIEYGVPIY